MGNEKMEYDDSGIGRTLAAGLLVVFVSLGTVSVRAAGTGIRAQPDWPLPVDDGTSYAGLFLDRLEYVRGDDEDALVWDAQFWYGGDYERLWIETEGEDVVSGGEGGEIKNLDMFYSRRFAPYWDWQAGVGYQRIYGPGMDQARSSAVLSLQGLAPYWFELDATVRAGEDGAVSAELEAEYEWLLTQRLIVQPRFETAYAFDDVTEFGVGRGLESVRLGLRLRYEIRRELAPYAGVTWFRRFGDTADLAEAAGGRVEDTAVVAGVRWWF
jgi:copper resistance protein B